MLQSLHASFHASARGWRGASCLAESASARAVPALTRSPDPPPGWPAGPVRLILVWGDGALPTPFTFSWCTTAAPDPSAGPPKPPPQIRRETPARTDSRRTHAPAPKPCDSGTGPPGGVPARYPSTNTGQARLGPLAQAPPPATIARAMPSRAKILGRERSSRVPRGDHRDVRPGVGQLQVPG
jgi:hypothetical protein